MTKETYERLSMDVTAFDVEDIITTSGAGGDESTDHTTSMGRFEGGLNVPWGF